MDTATYDQVALTEELLADAKPYLIADAVIQMQWFEGQAVSLELPPVVDLKVVDTTPSVKDATASAQRKPATLETGLVVQVPAFVEQGETIRVSTIDGSYAERVK
jgi:elongation factor P